MSVSGSSPANPTPTPATETSAFTDAADSLHHLRTDPNPPSHGPPPLPLRLINIRTGVLTPSDTLPPSTRYVIASYVWRPLQCPAVPTFGWVRRKGAWDLDSSQNTRPSANRDSPERWMAGSPHFAPWAKLLVRRYPNIIAIEQAPARFAMPSHRLGPEKIDPDYLEEVYQLVAREAAGQGLEWLWMDSLCVDQYSDADKAVQIPRMRDYYANAACCVVVSETVRRSVAPMAPVPAMVSDTADVVGEGMDSPGHLLDSWAVGFHDERVWTLQETLLAAKVVCRGGDVRIDASRLLDPEVRKQYRISTTGAMLNSFPTLGSLTGAGVLVTPQYCLRLSRNRGSYYVHDKVYGMLGLFPERVRKSLPIDYKTLTPAAVLAIFCYLRVVEGDLSALLTVWDKKGSPDMKCTTKLGPSWVPVGFGYAQTEIREFVPHDDVDDQVDVEDGHCLRATMAYTPAYEMTLRTSYTNDDDWVSNTADLMDNANYAVKIRGSEMAYGATVEVDDDYIQRLDKGKIIAAALGSDPRKLDNGGSENVWVWLLLVETEKNGWTRLGIMFTDEIHPPNKTRFRIV